MSERVFGPGEPVVKDINRIARLVRAARSAGDVKLLKRAASARQKLLEIVEEYVEEYIDSGELVDAILAELNVELKS